MSKENSIYTSTKPLSVDRLSLLNEQEHHQYYKDVYNSNFMNFNEIVESAPNIFGSSNLSLDEYKQLISEIMCSTNENMNIDYDPKKVVNDVNSYVDNLKELFQGKQVLNEAGAIGDNPFYGPDIMYWTKGLSWMGPLLAGLLGGAAYGLGKLISAGKQWLAVKKLKKYMDNVVLMADQGYSNRVGVWGKIKKFFGFGSKDNRNVDMGSFKSQATEVNRAFNGSATMLLKNMGIISGSDFQMNGGLYNFYGAAIRPMETK